MITADTFFILKLSV